MAKTPKLEKCPGCGTMAEPLPSGQFAECPECGLVGCEECLPGGRGCLCPECEEALATDAEDD
jgi:hypothetical protein